MLTNLFGRLSAAARREAPAASVLTVAVMMLFLSASRLAALPFAMPAMPFAMPEMRAEVDTAVYSPYSYVRFIEEKDTVNLTDEEFFDIAGKVIFPINKWDLPKRDSLIMQLRDEVFPLINRDSLELVYMMLRGAASPEGPTRWNKVLGEKRAETLLNFVKQSLTVPTDENFEMEIDVEDYKTLCIMMRRMGDKDYGYVQAMCDQYLPKGQTDKLKTVLRRARQGTLWLRLFREYFPRLRAARVVFFFRAPRTYAKKVLPEQPVEEIAEPVKKDTDILLPPPPTPLMAWQEKLPRRELLAIKTNLLFDFGSFPGYDEYAPIPNVAIEYFPKHGHFTYGASLDFPWWQHYNRQRYFQIRNYQLEARYYFRSGDIAQNPPGQGAAFRGFYLQGYGNAALYSICFDENRGWFGEALGGGIGAGYVLPLSKKGHWRLDFGLQIGYFCAFYDKYQWGNPRTGEEDGLYYYKWTQSPDKFQKRQHRFHWFGPTRIGITLSYDLLYRRNEKKGISFRPWEKVTKTGTIDDVPEEYKDQATPVEQQTNQASQQTNPVQQQSTEVEQQTAEQ